MVEYLTRGWIWLDSLIKESQGRTDPAIRESSCETK